MITGKIGTNRDSMTLKPIAMEKCNCDCHRVTFHDLFAVPGPVFNVVDRVMVGVIFSGLGFAAIIMAIIFYTEVYELIEPLVSDYIESWGSATPG